MQTFSKFYVRALLYVAAGLLALIGSGCVSVQMTAASASFSTIEKLRASKISTARVGNFSIAEGKDPSMDRSLSGLRGSTITPPTGSFSTQLRDQVLADLKAAGFLKEDANTVITGRLTDSRVEAAIEKGSGRLAAIFAVDRDGRRVFEKELSVEETWESAFAGVIAIPRAINAYSSFYQKLSSKLFEDADFLRVMR